MFISSIGRKFFSFYYFFKSFDAKSVDKWREIPYKITFWLHSDACHVMRDVSHKS